MTTAVTTAPATTLSGLWDDLKTEALNAWQALKNDAVAAEAKIVPVVESDLATILSQFKTVAVNTVMTLATAEFANLTGAQKQSITVNTVVQSALAAGKTVAQQDAVMLAQQAYTAVAATLQPAGN